MLDSYNIVAFVATTTPARAKRFYADILGHSPSRSCEEDAARRSATTL